MISSCTASSVSRPAAAPGSGSLTLVSLEPPAGAKVDGDTVVRAELAYELPGGRPSGYLVIAQFEAGSGGYTFDGTFPSDRYPKLGEPQGTVRIDFPLVHVLDDPRLAQPLVLWFFLNQRTAPRRSTVVARAGPFEYTVRESGGAGLRTASR